MYSVSCRAEVAASPRGFDEPTTDLAHQPPARLLPPLPGEFWLLGEFCPPPCGAWSTRLVGWVVVGVTISVETDVSVCVWVSVCVAVSVTVSLPPLWGGGPTGPPPVPPESPELLGISDVVVVVLVLVLGVVVAPLQATVIRHKEIMTAAHTLLDRYGRGVIWRSLPENDGHRCQWLR